MTLSAPRPAAISSTLLPVVILAALSVVCIGMGLLYPGAWDDAYISFVYVKNCAAGNGLTYNGTPVQGYSNPLWVLLLLVFARLGFDIPGTAIALGYVFGLLSIALAYALSRRFGLSRWWALLPAGLLSLQIDFAYYLGQGLETSLFAALFTLLFGLSVLAGPANRNIIALGVVGGLTSLCRTEGMILALGVCLVFALRTGWRKGLASAGISLLISAPWFIWTRSYYGAWLPNTIFAKVPGLSLVQARTGLHYLFPLSWSGVAVALLTLLLLAAVLFVRDSRVRFLALLLLIWCLFIVAVGGDHLVGLRFLVPALPLSLMIIVLLARQSRSLPVRLIILLVPLMLAAARWSDPLRRSHAASNAESRQLWIEIGQWFRENVPPESVIAVNPSGLIAYYSERPTIDMLGLNDSHIARKGKKDLSLRVGHQAGDGAYVVSHRPDFIMFGPRGGLRPSAYVSDREIYRHPDFRSLYEPLRVLLASGKNVIIYRRSGRAGNEGPGQH
jgi:hypothetical protein